MSRLVDWSPDSDYEIRKCNKSEEEMFGMTREKWEKTLLKAAEMSCDEQVKLLERAKTIEQADALEFMGEAERRELYGN